MLIPTLTQVDTSAKFKIGQRYIDDKGNEYIYLVGVASVVLGDICTYHQTTQSANTVVRAVADVIGQVCVAMAAIEASTYGWFQVKGWNLAVGAILAGAAAASKVPYLTSTAGLCDDVVVAGDRIHGMTITVAESASSSLVGVNMAYPEVTDESN